MIFVTGASGFLGSYLCEQLAIKGFQIKAAKRSSTSIPKKLLAYEKNITWVEVDLLDFDEVSDAIKDVDAIFHCAAIVSFNPKLKIELWRTNVDVTSNLVNAALQFPEIYFMHVSSIAAVGDAKPNKLIDEDCRWVFHKHSSDYSITKFESEREVWRGMHEGLKACIVNPSIILGYDERYKGSMKLISFAKKKLPFYTAGTVGYVDVQDVVNIMIELYHWQIVNERYILNSENCSYKQIFDILAQKMGHKPAKIELGSKTLFLLAWLFKFLSIFSSKSPLISLSTAKTANKKLEYSNDKIRKLLNYNFIRVENSLEMMLSGKSSS